MRQEISLKSSSQRIDLTCDPLSLMRNDQMDVILIHKYLLKSSVSSRNNTGRPRSDEATASPICRAASGCTSGNLSAAGAKRPAARGDKEHSLDGFVRFSSGVAGRICAITGTELNAIERYRRRDHGGGRARVDRRRGVGSQRVTGAALRPRRHGGRAGGARHAKAGRRWRRRPAPRRSRAMRAMRRTSSVCSRRSMPAASGSISSSTMPAAGPADRSSSLTRRRSRTRSG